MKGESDAVAVATSRTTPLALVCIVVWALAAALAGRIGIWLAVGGAAIALGLAVGLLDRAATRRSLLPSVRLVLLGLAAGVVMAAMTYALYPVLAPFAPIIVTGTAHLYATFRAPSATIATLALVPIILGEEVVWRGVVQGALVQRLGTWGGITATTLAYALAHAPLGSPILVAVAVACGLAWGVLRAVSASLVPALVAHLVWDLLVLLWLPLDAR
jgi:membrane protease YdiL (CAAX protease family)